MGSGNADGSFGPATSFNQTLFAALAKKLVDGSVPAATTNYIRTKQKPANGGWAFDADTGTNTDADVDTTSLAIQALIAGGVAPADPAVQNGLAFTASQQNGDGSWSAFGNVSSESTSRAILAIASAGYDPNSSCWRDTVRPDLAGSAYGAPDSALVALQGANGSIAGPGSFSPAFSTAQAVQGLEREWLPIASAASQTCAGAPGAPGAPGGAGNAGERDRDARCRVVTRSIRGSGRPGRRRHREQLAGRPGRRWDPRYRRAPRCRRRRDTELRRQSG
jgi:hypothetical protein